MNEVKAAVLFNRAILWIVMMYLTDNKNIGTLFAVCAVLNIAQSLVEALK
jgi:hypothetical protein